MTPLNWGSVKLPWYAVIFWNMLKFTDAWTTPFVTLAERIAGEEDASTEGERTPTSNSIRAPNITIRRVKASFPLALSVGNASLKGSRAIDSSKATDLSWLKEEPADLSEESQGRGYFLL